MQNLESQIHTLLEDIAPDVHSHEEQAKIIALASATISKNSILDVLQKQTIEL